MKSISTVQSVCQRVLFNNLFIFVIFNTSYAVVDFNSNEKLTISHRIDDSVRLDYMTPNDPGTELTLVEGGAISELFTLYHNSQAAISGGSTNHYIVLYNNSRLTVNDGSLRRSITTFGNSSAVIKNGTMGGGAGGGLWSYDTSEITVLGGHIRTGGYAVGNSRMTFSGGQIDLLKAWNNGRLTVTGGTIDRFLEATHSGIIKLVGSNFAINEIAVSPGQTAQDFAEILTKTVRPDGISTWSGIITGQLSDGSHLNNEFNLIDVYGDSRGNILFVPEPCTLIILGIGGTIISRKRT